MKNVTSNAKRTSVRAGVSPRPYTCWTYPHLDRGQRRLAALAEIVLVARHARDNRLVVAERGHAERHHVAHAGHLLARATRVREARGRNRKGRPDDRRHHRSTAKETRIHAHLHDTLLMSTPRARVWLVGCLGCR